MKPVRKPGIIVQDIGCEMLLYNTEGKAVHVLNPTAKFVWELCDGIHIEVTGFDESGKKRGKDKSDATFTINL